jgi:DNA-binding PadR family transcriptional regulator
MEKIKRKKKKETITKLSPNSLQIWESIAKNYEMVEGAKLSNSFIILMALNESKEPLNTTQISQIIALNTGAKIYKISATLKDSLEHRLKREGYVEGTDLPNKSLYSITPKGKKLLKGWIAFLSAYS